MLNARTVCLLIAVACFVIAAVVVAGNAVLWPWQTWGLLGVAAYIAAAINWTRTPG